MLDAFYSNWVSAELQRYLSDHPIVARPVSPLEHAWRWCRRNPSVASLTSAAVLLLVIIAIVSSVAYFREVKLVDEKDQLIQQKVGLIGEKDVLITEKDKLVIKERTAQVKATNNERLANDRAEKLRVKSDELSEELYNSNIARASSELDAREYGTARQTLDDIPLRHRNWEYRFLARRAEDATDATWAYQQRLLRVFQPRRKPAGQWILW